MRGAAAVVANRCEVPSPVVAPSVALIALGALAIGDDCACAAPRPSETPAATSMAANRRFWFLMSILSLHETKRIWRGARAFATAAHDRRIAK
jgi:hypothetical protein